MKRIINNKLFRLVFIICGIGLILFVFFNLGIEKESYAIDNSSSYKGDYILNPDWVSYMELSEEEKTRIDVIPEKFIYRYKRSINNKHRLFGSRSNNYPEYYNLNDYGQSTFPGNQGGLGVCWAFASVSSIETNMLKKGLSNISNPVRFSVRQFDYASVHHNYIKEGLNPYHIPGRTMPGSGGVINTAFILMETGISPVTVDKYGYFNEDRSIKSVNETFNLDDVEYVVDSYINYGALGDYTSDVDRSAWINEIKNHVMNYGSVTIGTIGPLRGYAGSCLYKDSTGNYMLNVNGECNPTTEENGHAMAIIGWDDNYSYKYCRLEDTTIDDLTNCDNIVSGKGAFILKNSWGDMYPYPYFAYTSNLYGAYGVTGVSVKNWDTNYDFYKENDYSYSYGVSSITYYKSSKVEEKLEKISFYTNTRENMVYDIYLSSDGSSDYVKIDSIVTDKIGLNSIYVDDVILKGEKFSIKIMSNNGYVDMIYAFTSDVNNNSNILIDTVIKSGDSYGVHVNEFLAYTVTKNVPNGDIIRYRLVNENDEDLTSLIKIYNNLNLNDAVAPIFKINDIFPEGKLYFQTIYNNQIYDSDEIEVTKLKNLWSGGTGSIEDPYLIGSADDFVKIFTDQYYMEAHYKLISDIDFSSIENWNVGSITNYLAFKGSLDGDNHTISGLKGNSNVMSLFYKLEGATILNLVFSDINWNIEESGWSSLLANLVYDSTIKNIIITKNVSITGKAYSASGLVATAYNSEFVNIANYGSISMDYDFYGRAAGIVGEAYSSTISRCYNYGNIVATNSTVGGIVAYLGNDTNYSSVGSVKNVYNYGNISSNIYSGGIVGSGNSTLVDSVYNIFSNNVSDKIGNIVGQAHGMVIKNSYYLELYGEAISLNEDNSSTLVNVMGKSSEQLKDKNTYSNFDFVNIWEISNGYPYFVDFYYFYMIDIEIADGLELNVGDKVNIDISFVPDNVSNKRVNYVIEDLEIASVDDDGNILALKEGDTILKIYALDGSGIEKEVKISVILDKVKLDDYVVYDDKYIMVRENFSIDNFINSIYDGDKYKIKSSSDNGFIGTGNKIEVYDKDDKLVFDYMTVVLGDVTGDSLIDLGDVAKLYQHTRGAFDMNREFKLASDVYNDSLLELNDVAKLYQYIRGGIENLEG